MQRIYKVVPYFSGLNSVQTSVEAKRDDVRYSKHRASLIMSLVLVPTIFCLFSVLFNMQISDAALIITGQSPKACYGDSSRFNNKGIRVTQLLQWGRERISYLLEEVSSLKYKLNQTFNLDLTWNDTFYLRFEDLELVPLNCSRAVQITERLKLHYKYIKNSLVY